ncbi:NAD(P)/FAD-dependent oxidoreductase [Methylomonas methanica]|uniref:FAD dependent oxidoreductase n=1 Tax=Methylomonas methanica (strain DSM 25384 / MC09) TaxID=857087 RepID=F9ZVQ9_METMM|nr:NAD(P)/FAD-dependent oxidoreductase [Methylomonas methanica]AEF99537.1 FAD dependent oxidoreductase [Methylomonas methanica MC09]
MNTTERYYDVAIIGTGIGGSTLASILARQGLSVIVFEGATHPRFTIGESMILETSEAMRALAEFYDVPELAYFSSENYYNLIGTSHGVKRHFSFLHHSPGESQNTRKSLQAVIPKLPYGHELHIHRQDSDYLLTSIAISYGAEVLQGTPVRDINIKSNGVEIQTDSQVYRAEYIVDAGGMKSLLAEKCGLRHRNLQAHTRALYTHMVNVPCFNDVGPGRAQYGHPFRVSEGTLHHIFKGGWLWVIPFNNHSRATNPLCSVGLQLDPRIYPLNADFTPEQEFYAFIDQFPDIRKQFKQARPVRAWMRTERLQYSSHHVVGDRFALLAHAMGFIDPLYSKGMYVTHMSVMIVADLILKAKQTGDYSASAFAPLEQITLRYMGMHDRLVANSFKSWHHHELWSVYAILWLLGAYLEYLKLTVTRLSARDRTDYLAQLAGLKLAGGGFAPFFELQEKVDTLIEQVNIEDKADVDRIVLKIRNLYAAYPWMPSAFRDLLDGKTFLPNNKLRVNLLNSSDGFLGEGVYRQHFFADTTLSKLIPKALYEQFRYGVFNLNWRKHA